MWSVNETQFALGGVSKGIRRRDLCLPDIYRSKQMSFFSWRNNGGRSDSSLNLVHKRGFAKLELKVHVIQTLIKIVLRILHETGFLILPFMSINQNYASKSGLQTVKGFVIPSLNLQVLFLIHHLEQWHRNLCSVFRSFETNHWPCYWPFWTEFVGIGHSCRVLCGFESLHRQHKTWKDAGIPSLEMSGCTVNTIWGWEDVFWGGHLARNHNLLLSGQQLHDQRLLHGWVR